MANPQQGDSYEFVGEPIGNDPGRINTGTKVTVREVVKAEDSGAHDNSEDAVVVEWSEPSVGYDEDGQPIIVGAPRAWAVGVSVFDELFTKEGN